MDNPGPFPGLEGAEAYAPKFRHICAAEISISGLLTWMDMMWVDPNLNDFYSRVSRIEKSHAKGYGF